MALNPTGSPEEIKDSEARLDEALNDKKFRTFLSRHPEDQVAQFEKDITDNPEKILEKVELYEKGGEAIKKLQGVLSDGFAEQLGLKVDKTALNAVENHVIDLLVEDPDKVLDIIKTIEESETLEKEVAALESQIAELGDLDAIRAQHEALKQKDAAFEKAGSMEKGTFFAALWNMQPIEAMKAGYHAFTEYRDARKAIKEQYGYKSGGPITGFFDAMPLLPSVGIKLKRWGIEKEMKPVSDIVEKADELEALKAEKDGAVEMIRNDLLSTLMGEEVIRESASRMVSKKLKELADGNTDITGLEDSTDFADRLAEFETITNNKFDNVDREAFMKQIDQNTNLAVANELRSIIKDSTTGSRALDTMVRLVGDLTDKEKIGSREGEGVKQFVINTLRSISETLPAGSAGIEKRLLINRTIVKLTK